MPTTTPTPAAAPADDALLGLFLTWGSGPLAPTAGMLRGQWRPVALTEGGECAAVALLRGTEIHFAAAPAWRGRLITRARTRAFLAPLMEPLGFLTTRSTGDGPDAFLTRMGFIRTWDEGPIKHWMLTALPFGKKD